MRAIRTDTHINFTKDSPLRVAQRTTKRFRNLQIMDQLISQHILRRHQGHPPNRELLLRFTLRLHTLGGIRARHNTLLIKRNVRRHDMRVINAIRVRIRVITHLRRAIFISRRRFTGNYQLQTSTITRHTFGPRLTRFSTRIINPAKRHHSTIWHRTLNINADRYIRMRALMTTNSARFTRHFAYLHTRPRKRTKFLLSRTRLLSKDLLSRLPHG